MAGLFGSTVLVSLNQSTTGAAAPLVAHRFERVDLTAWLVGAYLLTATVASATVASATVASATVASATVADVLPVAQRSRYQGLITSTTSGVTVVGPVLGGLLIGWTSWRLLFLVNVPIVLVLLAACRRMPPAPRRPVAIDYAGAVLLVTGVGALMTGGNLASHTPVRGQPAGWTLAVAGVLLLGFVLRELVAPDPIVPLRLFADRTFTGCALLSLFGGATLFASSLQLQQFLQLRLDTSPADAGLRMLPLFAGLALASVISGRRLARHGRAGHHLLAGTAGIAAGLVVLTGLAHGADPAILTGGMLLLGCGLGILLPTLGLLAQTIVMRTHLGAAISVIMLLRTLGGAVGTAVVGSLVAAQLTVQPAAAASSFTAGFPTLAAAAVPALATALMMRRAHVPGL